MKNLRSKVNNLVFVSPRTIPLRLPPKNGDGEEPEMDVLERPLRAETAQGPRVAIARSEVLPEGTSLDCALEQYSGRHNRRLVERLPGVGFRQAPEEGLAWDPEVD